MPSEAAQVPKMTGIIWHPGHVATPHARRSAEPAILTGRLAVMVTLAQRGPVVPIPEQLLIALVRPDVIHDGGRHDLALLETFDAQGVAAEVRGPGLLPAATVAPGRRTAALHHQ